MSYLNIRAPFNRIKVESAEELWDAFMSYMDHSDKTPLVEPKIFNSKDGIRNGNLDKIRPYTIEGLCNHIGMSPATWDKWKRDEVERLTSGDNSHGFFLDVMLQIESIVADQQFQGAAVDVFNASVMSRKLGLKDGMDLTSSDGSMTPKAEMQHEILEAMKRKHSQQPQGEKPSKGDMGLDA